MKIKLLFSVVFLSSLFLNAQNLVAFYPFNGNANDESGNNNNGTVNGATLTIDRFGNPDSAYLFDGVDDYILVPNSSSLDIIGNELTISMWLYNDNPETNNSWKGISKGGYDIGNGYELIFTNGNSNGNSSLNIGGGGYFTSSFNSFNNQWIMLTGTSNNGVGTMYINGIIQSHFQQGGINLNSSLSDLFIGKRNPANNYAGFLKGKIDDIRIYKSTLTAAEIASLYTNNTLKVAKIEDVTSSSFYVFNNTIYLKNTEDITEIKQIAVYNLLGQKVFQTEKIENEIKLTELQKGIHILKVKKTDGKQSSLKFLIE